MNQTDRIEDAIARAVEATPQQVGDPARYADYDTLVAEADAHDVEVDAVFQAAEADPNIVIVEDSA